MNYAFRQGEDTVYFGPHKLAHDAFVVLAIYGVEQYEPSYWQSLGLWGLFTCDDRFLITVPEGEGHPFNPMFDYVTLHERTGGQYLPVGGYGIMTLEDAIAHILHAKGKL